MKTSLLLLILVAIVYGAAERALPHRTDLNRRYYTNHFSRERPLFDKATRLVPGDKAHREEHPKHDYTMRRRYYSEPSVNSSGGGHRRTFFGGNGTNSYTTGMYRTYGSGKAIIPRIGATVTVSNSVIPQRAHKGTFASRNSNPMANRFRGQSVYKKRRDCLRCPDNRVVVATRGKPFVILPEPCPQTKWIPISGPKPGSIIREGIHSLTGRLGHRGKICHYQYEVVVRHCERLIVDGGNITCTAGDAWGSKCTVACKPGRELVGATTIECLNDLKWSASPPICKQETGCKLPQTPDNSKIWCQVQDEADLKADKLPKNTYCRVKEDGKFRTITCVDGYWVMNYKTQSKARFGGRKMKHMKHKMANDTKTHRNEILNPSTPAAPK